MTDNIVTYKTVKTTELNNQALDWAVALAAKANPVLSPIFSNGAVVGHQVHIGVRDLDFSGFITFEPSENWDQAGPLISHAHISLSYYKPNPMDHEPFVIAAISVDYADDCSKWVSGPTDLVAAMRCLVLNAIGDTVDIPVELL